MSPWHYPVKRILTVRVVRYWSVFSFVNKNSIVNTIAWSPFSCIKITVQALNTNFQHKAKECLFKYYIFVLIFYSFSFFFSFPNILFPILLIFISSKYVDYFTYLRSIPQVLFGNGIKIYHTSWYYLEEIPRLWSTRFVDTSLRITFGFSWDNFFDWRKYRLNYPS